MKILMITNNLPPYLNANSAIVYRIAEELHQIHSQEIVILGLQTASEKEMPLCSDYQIISIVGQYRYMNLVPAHFSKIHKLVRVLSHPTIWPMFFRYSFLRHPLCGLYKKKIRQILKEIPDIDCIIAFSEPTDIPCAVTEVCPKIPWVSYRLDPWATHILKSNPKEMAEEYLTNQTCSAIFVQPAVYQEYLAGAAQLPSDKIHVAEFPNLHALPENKGESFDWGSDGIHCAFVGQLYSDIRDPSFMLDLFAMMRGTGVVLHIIGNTPMQAEYWKDKVTDNIMFHGRVPYEKAIMYMQAADILVNLGNSVSNQMPSKIIDYLSTGKPILNIYKIKDCPSLLYMDKHPLTLSIYEQDVPHVSEIVEFCKESRGKKIPFAEMERIFKECTPRFVGTHVYRVICDVCAAKDDKR